MRTWRLSDLVYRELIVQAITQARRTGARPARIDRVVSGYRVMKIATSAIIAAYLTAPLIIWSITHWGALVNAYQSPSYDYATMYFIIVMIYALLSPITASIMGYPVVGDLLRVVGLGEGLIRRASIMAILRAVDIPLIVAIAAAAASSAILRTAAPILITAQSVFLGLMGPLMGIIALDTVVRRRGSTSATLTRALSVLMNSIPWLVALALLMLSENPGAIRPWVAQYVPIISDPLINHYPAAFANAVMITAALLAVDAYLLINAGPRLLTPRIPGGPESVVMGARKGVGRALRFRDPFTGLVRYYMRQLLSARGSLGMVIGGLIMAAFLYASLATSMSRLTQSSLVIGVLAYAAPLAFITSFLPVMLYNAEYAALPIILTIPMTPLRRMIAKIPMVLITYYAIATPMIAILALMHYPTAIPPVLALAASPLSSTAMAAVIFQLEVRDYLNGSQALAILNLVNVVMVIMAIAAPIIAFTAVQVITGNTALATTALLAMGSAETALLTLILIKISK